MRVDVARDVQALVSGPTFNYQRVMAEKNDLVTTAVAQANGSYTYTFPTALRIAAERSGFTHGACLPFDDGMGAAGVI